MNTLVIEDEGAARRKLEKIVKEHPALTHIASANSGFEAIQLINNNSIDLLLMDIQLKDMTAFDILKQVRLKDDARIIFVTAYSNYAVKAFEVYAIDYVLKPFTVERLLKTIKRITSNKTHPKKEVFAILEALHFPNKVCIPEGKKCHVFEQNEIEFIEADGYYCKFKLTNGTTTLIRVLLKKMEELLPKAFIRVNRSIVINKEHVTFFKEESKTTYFKLTNGAEFYGKKSFFR